MDIINVITSVIKDEDEDIKNVIYEIVNKIIEAPFDEELTIAKLLGITNDDVSKIEPLMQGTIYIRTWDICKKINIKLTDCENGLGGLAYHYKFKKIMS